MALVVMLSSSSAHNFQAYFKDSKLMKPYLPELKQNFCQVFRENSVFLREKFFNDPLVRAIWPHYMKTQLSQTCQYFIDLQQSTFCGGKSYKVLLSDIMLLREKISFDILQEIPR